MWKMLMPNYDNAPKRTTTEEILILFPYHKEGIPVSVPIVSKVQCSPQYKIHRKNTNLYCFEYIIEGTQYIITDKKYKASAGDFCIIHGNGKHLYYADKNNPPKKASICVYGNLIKELLNSYNITQTVFPKANVLHIFENLFQEKKDGLNYNYFCKKTAMAIHELIHAVLPSNQSVSIPGYIVQAKKILENSLEKTLDLNIVCKNVGISKPQLIKSFKQYYCRYKRSYNKCKSYRKRN